MLIRTIVGALSSAAFSSCILAHAEAPPPASEDDRAALRTAALAARDARLAQSPLAAEARDDAEEAEAACQEGTFAWQRAADIALCVQRCTTDAMCGKEERCVVLDDPSGEAVFADDVPDRFLEAAALMAESEKEPLMDEEPACDANCKGGYDGDLTIRPRMPLAVCDPFADTPEALLTDADIAALEAASAEASD